MNQEEELVIHIRQIYDGAILKKYFPPIERPYFSLDNKKHHCIPFYWVTHAIHNPKELQSFLVKDNWTNEYSVRIKANLNNANFPHSPLIWFAPSCNVNPKEHTDPYDYLNPFYNRYGTILIKIPLVEILKKYPNSFSMGTREFKQMVTHTILLSNESHRFEVSQNENKDRCKLPAIDIRNNDILSFGDSSNHQHYLDQWLWNRRNKYQLFGDKFEALDLCIYSQETSFSTFEFCFAAHTFEICKRFRKISCCLSSEDKSEYYAREKVMVSFWNELKKLGFSLESLRQHFDKDVYDELMENLSE